MPNAAVRGRTAESNGVRSPPLDEAASTTRWGLFSTEELRPLGRRLISTDQVRAVLAVCSTVHGVAKARR